MRRVVHLQEMRDGDVRVTLRRRERGVAEHLLDGTKVGAAVEHVRRAGVPQRVRVEIRASRAREPPLADEQLDRTRPEAAPARRYEQGAAIEEARPRMGERGADLEPSA